MRILMIVGWLFVGLGGAIFHYGPGQEHLEIDRVDHLLDQARACVSSEDWGKATDLFDEVLADLPSEKVAESRSVLLENCLLYTSPSPRDQRGSRMPSSA